MDELTEGSTWQCGPPFLSLPYESWPITTDEARYTARVPVEEVRASYREDAAPSTTLSALSEPCKDLARVLFASIRDGGGLGAGVRALALEAVSREKLEVSVRALARVLRAVVCGDRSQCARAPSRRFVELSVQLLLRVSSASARDALERGKLASLGAIDRGGIVWVQGRVRGEELARLLGTSGFADRDGCGKR